MIEDIQATFLHRFTSLARTRLAKCNDAVARRDPAALAVASRELHSLAGEAGLLGLAELVPLARRGEDEAKRAATGGDAADALATTLEELGVAVAKLGN